MTLEERVAALAQQVAALTDIVGKLTATRRLVAPAFDLDPTDPLYPAGGLPQTVWEQPPSLPAQVRGPDERRYMDPPQEALIP